MHTRTSIIPDLSTAKRVYQSPAIKMVKLGTATILAGSDQGVNTPQLTNDEGDYEF